MTMATIMKWILIVFCHSHSRYTVVLNGREAIQEALVKRASDFSDRPIIYMFQFFNPNQDGMIPSHITINHVNQSINKLVNLHYLLYTAVSNTRCLCIN